MDLTLDAAVSLNVPEPVLLQRRALIGYYRDRGILVKVNGDQARASITADIQARPPTADRCRPDEPQRHR